MAIAALATNYARAKKKPVRKREGWQKPTYGKLILNIDASFEIESGSGSTGVVIWDPAGSCIASSQCYILHVLDSPIVKAMALRNGRSSTCIGDRIQQVHSSN